MNPQNPIQPSQGPVNHPPVQPNPEQNPNQISPEARAENQSSTPTVEQQPKPITPEAPQAEQFADQPTPPPPPPPVASVEPPIADQAQPVPTALPTQGEIEEADQATDLDKSYVEATEQIVKTYEDKPFEEEEAHENLTIKYLWQRFKKKLKKSQY